MTGQNQILHEKHVTGFVEVISKFKRANSIIG